MKKLFPILVALFCLAGRGYSAVQPAEKLLPDDTLMMFTIPDFAKTREIYKTSPQGRLWNDPSMQAFKDKFVSKLRAAFLDPLERDLGIQFSNYTSLPQGQLTIAMLPSASEGKGTEDQAPGVLLLLDTKDKSPQLKSTLADLKKKWVDGGKNVKTEKIRDIEFSSITLSSKDLPKSLKKASSDGDSSDDSSAKSEVKSPIFIGQADSMLIMGNSSKAIEKVLASMSGSSVKSLSETAAFDASQKTLFRDASAFGWVNTKALVDMLLHAAPDSDEASASGIPKAGKIVSALGLTGLKTVAFASRTSADGAQFDIAFGNPESERAGLFKIISGVPKDSSPPPFVPADSIKFQRVRIDGQKAWAALRQMVGDAMPQMVGYLDYSLGVVESAAKEKDPNFDIKKYLFGNLGDDFITYGKASKSSTLAELNSGPTLFLIGSPNPEQLANALKSLLLIAGPQSTPTEREFLGHKIYSIPMPGRPTAKGTSRAGSLSYSFGASYLAISADTSMLEEYLRSSQEPAKPLRDTPGFSDASQKVMNNNTYLFGYSNDSESMRVLFDVLTKDPNFSENPTGQLAAAFGADFKLKDWADVSLLPSFDKISKYFYFSVYGASVTPEGISFKAFAPAPPQLKQ